jgi:hypothetical protein
MSTEAARWINTFPVRHHATIAAWFQYAASQGVRSPEAMLVVVTRLVGYKLDWATTDDSRQLCHNALQALRCGREGALAFAGHILTEEAQP